MRNTYEYEDIGGGGSGMSIEFRRPPESLTSAVIANAFASDGTFTYPSSRIDGEEYTAEDTPREIVCTVTPKDDLARVLRTHFDETGVATLTEMMNDNKKIAVRMSDGEFMLIDPEQENNAAVHLGERHFFPEVAEKASANALLGMIMNSRLYKELEQSGAWDEIKGTLQEAEQAVNGKRAADMSDLIEQAGFEIVE